MLPQRPGFGSTGAVCAVALAVAVSLLVVGLTGCGSKQATGSATSAAPSTPPPAGTTANSQAPSADEGCGADEPVSVEPGPELSGFVVACAAEDQGSLVVTNVSEAVLDVSTDDPYADATVQAGESDDSLATLAVAQFVSSDCEDSACVVAPGDGVLVEGEAPVVVTVDVDAAGTGAAEAARFVGQWVERQLRGDVGDLVDK